MDKYREFIAKSRYARYLYELGRREDWPESVARYMDFMEKHLRSKHGYKLSLQLRTDLENAIVNHDVMPSMRSLATAGPALDRCNVAAYNCSYLPINSPRSFDELFYILLCGTGVGYSVERQYTNELPTVAEHFEQSSTTISVADSKSGWARALKELIALLYQGQIPQWDVSKVRPAGARLKTFGGRASGPAPLVDLFRFTVDLFQKAKGRQLNSLECHDLCCKIASAVVVGGVRRSAMISLSNLSDTRMRDCKKGEWFNINADRSYANNSVVYTEKPDMNIFMGEWKALHDSRSGERGIYYRKAAQDTVRKTGRRDPSFAFGTNPCSEIILRPFQFCNLTEVVVRANDTLETLERKVKLASILGTFQSTLSDFKYLRKIWKDNTEEERLLGVSLTGICDSKLTYELKGLEGRLSKLRDVAVEANKVMSRTIGIQQSTSVTCVKPSGTVSQLVNSASGIHPRYADYYIRRVRGDRKDPLTQFLADQGVPVEPCAYKPQDTVVFSFPIKTEGNSLTREHLSAIDQLELWKVYQESWCEHKPSCTVYVRDDEWLHVGAWVYENFEKISGISFLPYDGGTYTQAPYEEIDEKTYKELDKSMPNVVDWSLLSEYEKEEDNTMSSQEFACTGDVCEIVDVGK